MGDATLVRSPHAGAAAFRHYARPSSLQPICIETRRYPVSVFHLEDLLAAPMLRGNAPMLNRLLPDNPASTLHGLVAKMSRPPPTTGGMGSGSAQSASSAALGPISNSLLHVISWLCSALALCHRSDPVDGNCVLVFFPGLAEIEAAAQMIDEGQSNQASRWAKRNKMGSLRRLKEQNEQHARGLPLRLLTPAVCHSRLLVFGVSTDLLKRSHQKTVRTTIDAEGQPQEEEVYDDEDDASGGGSQWRRGGAPSLGSDTEMHRASPLSQWRNFDAFDGCNTPGILQEAFDAYYGELKE